MGLKNMMLSVGKSYLENQTFPNQYMPMDPKYFYKYIDSSWKGSYITPPSYGSTVDSYSGSGLDMLLNQKKQIVQSKIQMVVSEIYQRYQLKNDNLYKIDLDVCACRYLIHRLGEVYLDKRRIDLERQVLGLEQEKRRERALYFRDVSFLRKELRESLIEKLEEDQKANFFMNQTEELPCTTQPEMMSIS